MKMKQHIKLPVMNFFEMAAPENSQDAPGLEKTILSLLFQGTG